MASSSGTARPRWAATASSRRSSPYSSSSSLNASVTPSLQTTSVSPGSSTVTADSPNHSSKRPITVAVGASVSRAPSARASTGGTWPQFT